MWSSVCSNECYDMLYHHLMLLLLVMVVWVTPGLALVAKDNLILPLLEANYPTAMPAKRRLSAGLMWLTGGSDSVKA